MILADEGCWVPQSFACPPKKVASHQVLRMQAMSIQQPQLCIFAPMGTDSHLQQPNVASGRTWRGQEVRSCLDQSCTRSEPCTQPQAPAGSLDLTSKSRLVRLTSERAPQDLVSSSSASSTACQNEPPGEGTFTSLSTRERASVSPQWQRSCSNAAAATWPKPPCTEPAQP